MRHSIVFLKHVDRWNPNKVWFVKHYADGHYALNQEISGRKFYSAYQRAKKAQVQSILNF